MNSVVKPIITILVALIAISILLIRTTVTTNNWSNDELEYALRVATQDATAVMMDENYIFSDDNESSDFNIDLNKASKQFKRSFYANIGSVLTPVQMTDTNIALSGYVGYRYIYGIYSTGSQTAAFSYSYSMGNKLYEFTLGDKIYVTDLTTGTESTSQLSGLPENYFSSDVSNENFRKITVMKAINEYLTVFYSDEQNITAYNAGSGIEFDLGLIDYAENDPSIMTTLSAVIDGPGFFAVVDCWDSTTDQMVRLFSLSAAELVLR